MTVILIYLAAYKRIERKIWVVCLGIRNYECIAQDLEIIHYFISFHLSQSNMASPRYSLILLVRLVDSKIR